MIIANISPRSTGKSTNTAWLAHAIHQRPGMPGITVFDADESHQLTNWYAANDWPFPVHGAAHRRAHHTIPAAMPAGGHALVDVGHLENHRDIGYSCMRIADLVLINCAPTLSDVERLQALPMLGALEDVASLRPDDTPPPAWVLLTRCQPGTTATKDCRIALRDLGYNVLSTIIPARQMYAQTGTGAPINARGSAHDCLLTELEEKALI